jgi:Resolvase, N terminal domain/Helix-turn-helix domain of resolvase
MKLGLAESRFGMKCGYARVSDGRSKRRHAAHGVEAGRVQNPFHRRTIRRNHQAPCSAPFHEEAGTRRHAHCGSDRLGRSLRDLIAMLDCLRDRGVNSRSITEAIDTETPTGRVMWQMIGMMAEYEHSLISERTRAGVKDAKKRGVKFERKKKLAPAQIIKARKLIESGERVEDVAALWNVGRTTLDRASGVVRGPIIVGDEAEETTGEAATY